MKTQTEKKHTMLLILDGFGYNQDKRGNAILAADTPNLDGIFKTYPHTTIGACGLDVGLPEGQMGNSEVGHMNIGAGRIVYQDLTRITKSIEDGAFFKNEVLRNAMEEAVKTDHALHLLGLLSDGGVHSHIDHLKALLKLAKTMGVKKVFVHAFLDGRDVPPRCALKYVEEIEAYMKEIGLGRIATIGGRYYGMDRDKRWDRIKKAYDAMVYLEGLHADSASDAVKQSYDRDEGDEFVVPTVVAGSEAVKPGDSMIMFNFRPDRARQITRAFVDPEFSEFPTEDIKPHYVTMTTYDATIPNVEIAYEPDEYKNTMGEYISSLGYNQLRIAETEKYAHVTFFFNGGVEEPYENEDRVLVPSPKVATYDLQPEMSAPKVTEEVLKVIDKYDLIVLNFANADMVGHTGSFEAAVKAVETLDECIGKIVNKMLSIGGKILLTADHGNADVMLDDEDKPMTAHSLNVVPLVYIADKPEKLKEGGRLCDLSPTLLDIMGIDKPAEMTGKSLIDR